VSNLLFSVGFMALIATAILVGRSLARFAILTLFTLTVSGAILQFLFSDSGVVNLAFTQWWLLVTGIVLVVLSFMYGTRGKQAIGGTTLWHKSSNWILIGSSALITGAFLASRFLAPGELSPLSSVGFFVQKEAAEDNAKWLNATSQLADASIVDTWANVGGPLLLVMSLAATLIGAMSYLLYGAINEVAVSAGSVIFTQIFLVIIAPFALAPIVERTFKKVSGGKQLPPLYSLMSIAILTASTAVMITYGHVTLQFTLLALTLWIAVFLAPIPGIPGRLFTTLSVIATAMVWFPMGGLSLILLIASLLYFVRGLISNSGTRRVPFLIGAGMTVLLGVIMFKFLNSSLRYSLGIDAGTTASIDSGSGVAGGIAAAVKSIGAPTFPLFDDPGGTETVTTVLLILTLVSLLGLVWVKVGRGQLTRSQLLTFSPIGLAGGYALLIALADFWAVGSGPNYGSLKISFAVFLPILVASLPFALMVFHRGSPQINALGIAAVASIAVLLTLDTLFPRAILQIKPTNWPSISSNPYWYPAEVRDTGDQTLASNPIGCLFLTRGALQPSALPQGQLVYTCSRLLSGVAGVELLAAPIVKWQLDEWLQNREMWSEMHPYFISLNPEILSRSVILLDQDRSVVGLETINGLLSRYPPVESS
jgi:hypothetical protein